MSEFGPNDFYRKHTIYCLWNFLPFSADNCPDRLFLSSLAVAHDAAVGVPPVASETLTMRVEYSLVSVVYLILGGCHYVTVPFARKVAQVRLHRGG